MLKRTLFFESPGYINLSDKQLCFSPRLPRGDQSTKRVPIEDIGLIVVENSQIIFTSAVMQALAANNAIVVFCDEKHLPASTFSAMNVHSTMQRTVQAQLKSTEALRGRLWKQTVIAKIINQSQVLSRNKRPNSGVLLRLAAQVKNGDPENIEATAARYYFSSISTDSDFIRDPEGFMPNAALNYGYAIIRAAMARALVGSGLLCIVGIHHHNQYNAYCLADDIMEPYRPFVDEEIFGSTEPLPDDINGNLKRKLLNVLTADVSIKGMKRPLMNAMSYTTASLARCFLKEQQEIDYPEFC